MSLLAQANSLLLAADYAAALELYEEILRQRPQLAAALAFNLDKARRGLAAAPPAQAAPADPDRPLWLADLYAEVRAAAGAAPATPPGNPPLVTVALTAHNVEDYVEESICSLLRQSHRNLEIIAVDDCSTDRTPEILRRLGQAVPNLTVKRLNANLGTYFAKNYAVMLAKGEYVFFQDGDDLCHPERIALCLRALLGRGAVCVRGSYSRVAFPEGRVLPVNGLAKKLGLITLGLKRQVFADIGYFNGTTKASDEELFCRLQAYYGKDAVVDNPLPLYYNTFREGSLFADMVANDPRQEQRIEQRPSPSRARYVEAFRETHRRLRPEEYKGFFSYPALRDLIPVDPDMTRLENPRFPVVFNVCSIPERREAFARTLASIAPQADAVNIYLDRYDEVPACVQALGAKARVHRSQDLPNLRDNGKFIGLKNLDGPAYYFTVDDDILYPPDYAQALIRKIEAYRRAAVVGVHGVLIPDRPQGYYSGFRAVHCFDKALEQDRLVNNLGSGTVAFFSPLLDGFDYAALGAGGMVDLHLAVFCKQRGVPMVALARHADWLADINPQPGGLYHEFKGADRAQSALLAAHPPWGYEAIRAAVAATTAKTADPDLAARLAALVPVLRLCTA